MITAPWTRRAFVFSMALLAALAPHSAAEAGSVAASVEWPFPEFTKQGALEVKASIGDGYLSAAPESGRMYILTVLPLEAIRGSLATVIAAATGGKPPKQMTLTRHTDTRGYFTRGTDAAPLYADDPRAYPAEVVIEIDRTNRRLLAFYKINFIGYIPLKHTWDELMAEAARWAMAAEGK